MPFYYDSTFVVAVSFVLFLGILVWAGVPGMIAKALDARAAKIRHDLDEARRLRDEAQTLLASFERKQKDVERLASEILARAADDARAAADAGRAELERTVARRLRSAEDQIASAEQAAIRQVRDEAVNVAVAAAAAVLRESMTPERGAALTDAAIAETTRRLN